MLPKLQNQAYAISALLFAMFWLFAAHAATHVVLPPAQHADTETTTNVPFAMGANGRHAFRFALSFAGTPSNNVEVAFGADGDSRKSSGGIAAAENFVHQLPALWAHGTEDELLGITTNTVDAILSNKDAEKRDLAFTYCADAVAVLNVESRNDEDYDRSLDMRGYLIEMMLRYSGKTDNGILLGFDCRVKFYETLKRESVKFPVVKLPRFVDDLRTAMADKYGITNNIRYVSKDGFTPEGIAKRRKEMNKIARAVSKRRKRAEYGGCVRRGMEDEEKSYFDNSLKYYYDKLSGKCNTNILEKVRATIGRYPKWYSPR